MTTQKMLLIFLLSLSGIRLTAQKGSEQLLKVFPPSPTVASLGKYGELPVSLYTGIPNISIPLFEIKDGSLNLPVSLSYHAGGIKVEEIAPSVGLSWSLNAGGVIGKNVRGLPDELGPWQAATSNNNIDSMIKAGNATQLQQIVREIDDGYRDGEADIYYYNFNQFSGKFFYDQKGAIHTIPVKNILTEQKGNGWKITTEDGTVYTFNKVEEVRSSGCSGDQTISAAWFLTNIKSLDGKREINFIYEQVVYTYETLMAQTKYFSTNSTGSSCMSNTSPCLGTQNYTTHRLKRINFGDGYISFNYNTLRYDLMDDKSLDEVKVYNNNNQQIKGFKFGYSYFGDNSDGYNYYTKNAKRLKLVSITEENAGIQKPPYLFEYDESVALPGRLSYAQDHWGYYNGQLNNADLIATFTTAVFSGAQITFPGANRDANPKTAQAGILKKITYPTGGETMFTYESNTVSDARIKPQVATTNEMLVFGLNDQVLSNFPHPFESTELVIPSGGAQVQFQVSGLSDLLWAGCDSRQCLIIKDNNPIPFGRLADSWNGVTDTWPAGRYKFRLDSDCGVDARASFQITATAKIPLNMSPASIAAVGGLRIKSLEDKAGDRSPSIIKNYRYHVENDTVHSSGVLVNFPDYGYDLNVHSVKRDEGGGPQGPGNYCSYRVRQSFSNYPMATTQGSYVGYSHVVVDFGDNGESWYSYSAHSDQAASFPFAPVDNFDWSRGFLLGTKDFIRRNGSLILAKETINAPFSFNHVDVYGIKTGRDVMYIDDGATRPNFQQLPKYSFYKTATEAYVLGQTKEKIYDQDNPVKFIETATKFTYSPDHLQLTQSSSVTSKRAESVVEEIISYKKYPFDYNFSSDPIGSEAQGIKNLQDLHAVNAITEEYVLKQNRNLITGHLSNQKIIEGAITLYKSDKPYPDQLLNLEIGSSLSLVNFGNGSGLNFGSFIKNSSTDITDFYKPVIVFNSYDDNGNITTQQNSNDIKKSYIWGYGSRHPIAEIVGEDYATIIANSNLDQSVLQSIFTSDEDMRTELNKIRTSFPAALVTTYTYKPLIGPTSQTDINNRSTYYEYDAFGRLVLIRDNDKNILKKFCYNYRGQQGNCTVSIQAN